MPDTSPFQAFYQGYDFSLNTKKWASEFDYARTRLLAKNCPIMKIGRGNKPKNQARYNRFFRTEDDLRAYKVLTHSFVRINNEVYAMLPHGDKALPIALLHGDEPQHNLWEANPAFAGVGADEVVKYAIDRHHQQFVIKIQRKDKIASESHQSAMTVKAKVDQDLGLLLGQAARQTEQGAISYSLEPYLGENLQAFLSNHQPGLAERLNIAIQLFWQTHLLHSGRLSKRGITLANNDLKPDNIVYNPENKKLTIIDFAYATSNINECQNGDMGTPGFMPDKSDTLTAKEHDLFSAKRVVIFPKNISHNGQFFESDDDAYHSLLTKKELEDMALLTHFSSEDVNTRIVKHIDPRTGDRSVMYLGQQGSHINVLKHPNSSAAHYAALLVLAEMKLSLPLMKLSLPLESFYQTPLLSEAVLGLYFAGFNHQQGDELIAHIHLLIENERVRENMATFANVAEALPAPLATKLCEAILNERPTPILDNITTLLRTPIPEGKRFGLHFWLNATLRSLNNLLDYASLETLLQDPNRLRKALSEKVKVKGELTLAQLEELPPSSHSANTEAIVSQPTRLEDPTMIKKPRVNATWTRPFCFLATTCLPCTVNPTDPPRTRSHQPGDENHDPQEIKRL